MLLTNELIFLTFLCLLGTQGRPSLSFNLHPFNAFGGFGGGRSVRDVVKKYSGQRVSNDSLRMVYFSEQTVSIVELGEDKLLLNCEFIEVYNDGDAIRLLTDLEQISPPLHIEFADMLMLMSQCNELETEEELELLKLKPNTRSSGSGRGILSNNPFTLFSGIIPGTKWCGTGDIADHYHDLGADKDVDRCCRTHDLCPIKIRGNMKRYNISNSSYYTKTHCDCDDRLYECLKSGTGQTANILGHVYFNLVQVPCVEGYPMGKKVIHPTKHTF